jgi:hypothetical protein
MSPEVTNRSTIQKIAQRRALLEHRLFWRGRLGLSDLTETLGLSRTQSSQEINSYIKEFPEHLFYDPSARAYFPGRKFKPHYASLDGDKHLAKLLAMSHEAEVAQDDWELFTPDIEAPPSPARSAKPEIVRDVVLAIEQGLALNITYQSMSSPEPSKRSIAPHALAHDGFRWHARALCLRDNLFKDFVLGRMLKAELGEKTNIDPTDDRDWATQITLEISPHPNLSDSQKKVIALDYGMENGSADLTIRKSMLYYTLKRLGLDADPSARRAQEQHIVLVNADDVFAAMGRPAPW